MRIDVYEFHRSGAIIAHGDIMNSVWQDIQLQSSKIKANTMDLAVHQIKLCLCNSLAVLDMYITHACTISDSNTNYKLNCDELY